MAAHYEKSVFFFRRDLRLTDNSALRMAHQMSAGILTCFVFDPRQVSNNRYFSARAFQFLLESLSDLSRQIERKRGRLSFFHCLPEEALQILMHRHQIEAVFLNRDYTPFSISRDRAVAAFCRNNGLAFHTADDALLFEPERLKKPNGHPYTVYTPFFKRASQLSVAQPQTLRGFKFLRSACGEDFHRAVRRLSPPSSRPAFIIGGRAGAQRTLDRLVRLKDYSTKRDIPALDATSKLSPHLKFGTCSIREAYQRVVRVLGRDHPLIRQFFWRDFFTHVAFNFPRVFGRSFHEKYERIEWRNNRSQFKAWRDGCTGFPIVDAGMRELNTTGYMHNRVRMIAASFLTKDLLIDWRWGERYFARSLIDYDPAVNNGNWQWAASTGCDAQPYFRDFNPWLQQKKFDPGCLYNKRWVPELELLTPAEIHGLWRQPAAAAPHYPRPIVDHQEARSRALRLYQA